MRFVRQHVSPVLIGAIGLLVVACDDTTAPGGPDTRVVVDTTAPDTGVGPEITDPGELTITAVSPDEGHTVGLEEVQISGFQLGDVTQVRFGDAPALDVFVVSSQLVVCLTPPQSRGVVDVTVVDSEGRVATLARGFNYRDPVTIASIEPAEGHWLGGEAVTIYGAGFAPGSVVLIGGRAAPQVAVVDDHTINVVTPEGAPGPADVHVSSADGIARARAGFLYTGGDLPLAPLVAIERVTPSRGPAAGGTAITIEGAGFHAGMSVRVGALPAVEVAIEGTRIRAKTPPGSPGPATVRVLASGAVASAPGAFTFEGAPAVWAVDPPRGAVAGGTIVRVRGAGFPASPEVLIGDAAADVLGIEPDGAIRVKTPPGDVGLVPVRVRGGGVDVAHPRGFVYIDPAANPGTWGDPIDGALNVTVIEARSGARVPSAFVLVGDVLTTKHRGYTDINGQITFSGDDLLGEQRVTASVPGKQIFQLGGFDAENVTLAVERIPTCQDLADIPCDMIVDPPPSATLDATIIGSTKGPTIPFGACADWPDAPNGLCQPCAIDDDCVALGGGSGGGVSGGGPEGFGPARCAELGSAGAFCSAGCVTDADCPGTFVCLDPTGVDEDRRCVPPPGEWAAYCDVTEPDMGSEQLIPYPGVPVEADRTVSFTTRLGNFALFCWGGEIVRTEFRPRYLGVARHLGAFEDGGVVTAEVKLDIPLDEEVVIEIDRPTLGPVSDENTLLRTLMNLGGDGVLEFPPQRAFGQRRFTMTVPARLDGALYDATWDLFAQVEVPSLNGGSAALEPGLKDLNPVIDYALEDGDDGAWTPITGFTHTIRALAIVRGASGGGDGSEAMLAVGDDGLVARSFNGTWAWQQSGTERDLHTVAVAPEADPDGVQRAIIGGVGGFVAHWDGLRWVAGSSGVVTLIEGVAFADGTTAWAVSGKTLLRYDGAAWSVAHVASAALHAVAADATRVWAFGDGGLVVLGQGGGFGEVTVGASALRAVWRAPQGAVGGGALTVVGDGGAILTSPDGITWSTLASGTDNDLHAVWGRAADDVWAAGARATIVHWDGAAWVDQTPTQTRGAVRALGGIAGGPVLALGSHELVLGPLLGIPEGLTPTPGGALGDRLSWTARTELLPHFTLLDIGNQIGPCSACGFMFMLPYGEWLTVLDGDLWSATYPDFRQVQGALGLGWGVKGIGIYRVRSDESFDFDHTASTGFYGGTWRAWSWRSEAWTR
ncbi:MAG: IPT/TIG domain-containing protein [Deltaproteobacteria bacterium]|nr:IPT/TIG domain-containing protein [Deltaproteobacteria bacterium]